VTDSLDTRHSFNLGRVETDVHRSGTEYSSLCYTCDTWLASRAA